MKYDAPTLDGKRKQVKIAIPHATKEREAQAALAKVLAEIGAGTYVDSGAMTFRHLVTLYLEARRGRVAPTTLALYKRVLTTHVVPAIGDVRLSKLDSAHINTMLNNARDMSRRKSRNGKPLSATTLNHILIVVRAVLAWAVKEDKIARNVAKKVERLQEDEREIVPFTAARVQQILQAVQDTELEAVVTVAIGTGLRRGELCGLRWCDADLDTGTISVQRTITLLDGNPIAKKPKTRRSRRNDIMPAFVVNALQRHRKDQRKRHMMLGIGKRATDDDYVFDRADGTPWNPNELSRQFSRLVRRKRLGAIRFHDLRHGYATIALAAGVPLKVVSDSMGHARIGITADKYIHPADEQRRLKARMLDGFLNGSNPAERTA